MDSNPKPADEEFSDPLENYEPPQYEDALEQALDQETVEAIQSTPFATISPDVTIEQAVAKLASQEIACLLVEQDGKLVGVFSDRDLLDKAALEYNDVKHQPVSSVMTTDPVFVYQTDSAAAAISVTAVSGYRHVPVVDLEENLLGIVSPQRVTKFLREHRESD